MTNTAAIRRLKDQTPISVQEASSIGITRYQLGKFEQRGLIEKIGHGLYVLRSTTPYDEDRFRYASYKIGSEAVICLLSALEYYNLTDIIAKQVWLMVPATKRTRQQDIRLLRVAQPHMDVGINKQKGFRITSIERTLVDCLTHQRQLPTAVGIEALRRALSSKRTTLSNVADMAKRLDAFERILPYLEALA